MRDVKYFLGFSPRDLLVLCLPEFQYLPWEVDYQGHLVRQRVVILGRLTHFRRGLGLTYLWLLCY